MACKKKTETVAEAAPAQPAILAIKGFGPDWTCRGFQFEIGKTYRHEGKVAACESGFHSIEGHPLEVFDYYAPGLSRYAEVEASGEIARHNGDSKIASAQITIKAELHIPEIVARAVKWVFDRALPTEGSSATGDQGAASATGVRGAASATGYQGAASATGYQGAASATGDQGAASATGERGAAMACGYAGRVSGADGNALFLTERDDDGNIIAVWAGIVGRDGIKAGVWYALKDGKPTEAQT